MNLTLSTLIKNPIDIPSSDMPLIVFSDCTSGLIEWLIKWKTKGYFNHVMIATRKGYFASQGNTYSEIKMDRYMKRNMRLKFYKINGLTANDKKYLYESIAKKLALPWYRKMYDWVGIVGQALGWKFLNWGGLNYCSEDIYIQLTSMLESRTLKPEIFDAIYGLPEHGDPEDINKHIKSNDVFEIYGFFDSDYINA